MHLRRQLVRDERNIAELNNEQEANRTSDLLLVINEGLGVPTIIIIHRNLVT